MEMITVKQLLETGVHFGHQTQRWNPKMAEYINCERGGVHIIDLQKTLDKIVEALAFVTKTVSGGGKVLFVGTKKQANPAVAEEAMRCGMHYIDERWPDGLLTNFGVSGEAQKELCGIKGMCRLPEAVFIVDTNAESAAVSEARAMGIPIVAIADTNCDPGDADYLIPGNDDAIRAIKLIIGQFADAILEAKQV